MNADTPEMTETDSYYYYTPSFTEEDRESLKDLFGRDLFGKGEPNTPSEEERVASNSSFRKEPLVIVTHWNESLSEPLSDIHHVF